MKQSIDLEQLTTFKDAMLTTTPSAHLESLQALQEAYEEWQLAHEGVGVLDFFWSWNIQA